MSGTLGKTIRRDNVLSATRLLRSQQDMETEKKKKGLLTTIWESMTKTGGCCGPGESCCGPAKKGDEETAEKKAEEESDK